MTSNLLQDVLRHTAHGHIDAHSHDKDDSDDELVNVVGSILSRRLLLHILTSLVLTPRNTTTLSPVYASPITFSRQLLHAFLVVIY
jgi:hypothetical protein